VLAAGVLRQAGVAAFKSPDSFANILLATLSFQGATWILILMFLKQHEVNWRDAFGLRKIHYAKFVFLVLGVLILALLVEWLSAFVLEKLGFQSEAQRAVELIVNAKSWWLRGYLAFFAMVLAPVAEEFIFRGVLFPFVKQLGWPRLAWFGVSFLFAAIHLNAPTFVPLFVLALVLTWLYQKTDCLLAPIAAHSLFNTANLVILFAQNR
jgi:membrane protease YdiL (CAAX protease family)